MISMNLQGVAELVVRQAQRNGYVVPRQVRTVLNEAGLDESMWKDVLAVASPSLTCRKGRYYYTAPVSDRVRQELEQQNGIRKAVREIIRRYRSGAEVERRQEDRMDFVQSVKVQTEDGQGYTLLTRDLSSTGIRLIGTRRFLGQKIRVSIPVAQDARNWEFIVRILWTCAVGDDLVENGGAFLEIVEPKS
jgi:SOS response regulatory protein OraA/RecX